MRQIGSQVGRDECDRDGARSPHAAQIGTSLITVMWYCPCRRPPLAARAIGPADTERSGVCWRSFPPSSSARSGSSWAAAAAPCWRPRSRNVGIGLLGVSLAFGLTVLTMAYALGPISGGHFNPAVSVGLWAGGRFPAAHLLPYVVAQVLGAHRRGAACST